MELNDAQLSFKKSFKQLRLVEERNLELDDLATRLSELNGLIGGRKLSDSELSRVLTVLTQELEVTMSRSGTVVDPSTFQRWLADRKVGALTPRWDAYQALLVGRDWEERVIRELDQQADEVVELMGDPAREGSWIRRGLMMGEVQSGKTANYIGILNKALDYGYKVVIVIGGHTNELRKQTQSRIDSDLLGIDSEYVDDNISTSAGLRRIGIGLIDATLRAHLMTTVRGDFNSQRKTAGVTWIDSGLPTVFVIKKHAGLISNVANYIRQQASAEKLDLPLVVIDDEADWGTPNTGSETDPTRVNREIRKLLDVSTRSSYLGITATPFANIFINDEVQDPNHGQDLFPSDYIRVLSAPSTYFGIDHYFWPVHGSMRLDVEDCLEALPIVHKKTHQVDVLPASLQKATICFLLGTAVRHRRSSSPRPASMLVNVSRFNDVQALVASLLGSFLETLRANVLSEFARNSSTKSPMFQEIRSVWLTEFRDIRDVTWDDVRESLLESVNTFRIELVNSKTVTERNRRRRLLSDEQRASEDLAPTIFVGGDVLSRGLTLDGLQVSYFVREPRTMDTLMQMGRWFGYRPGYSDLVRVWLPEDTADDFAWSASTTKELKELLLEMRSRNLTPKDFGLRVRTHPEGFKIVAANKSKSTEQIYVGPIVWENRLLESNRLPLQMNLLAKNREAFNILINSLSDLENKEDASFFVSKGGYLSWSNVPISEIQGFFARFIAPMQCDNFGPGLHGNPSIAFESLTEAKNSSHWDVSVVNGDGPATEIAPQRNARITIRDKLVFEEEDQVLRFPNRRVASGNNLTGSLSNGEFARLENQLGYPPTQSAALEFIDRPRLLLYLTALKSEKAGFPGIASTANPAVAVAIAYPKLDPEEAVTKASQAKQYTGNAVYLRNRYGLIEESDDIEDGLEDG